MPPPPPSLPHRFPAQDLEGESSDDAYPPRREPFRSVTALPRQEGARPRIPPRGSSAVPDLFGSGWHAGESSSEWESDGATEHTPIMAKGSPASEEDKGRQCCGGAASTAPAGPSESKPKWSPGTWALCMLLETFLTLNFVFVQGQYTFPKKAPAREDEKKPSADSEVVAKKWATAQLEKFGLVESPPRTALAA